MKKADHYFSFEIFDSTDELEPTDVILLEEAKKIASQAYAPYSGFRVGAVARLAGGRLLSGTNQENASFPAGICAERVLLSAVSSVYPGLAIETIAVSFEADTVKSDRPISPCGICRQTLCEYEQRQKSPIRLILGGQDGKVFVLDRAGHLLPLAFSGDSMK